MIQNASVIVMSSTIIKCNIVLYNTRLLMYVTPFILVE